MTCIQLICEFGRWTWNNVWSIYLIHLCKYTFLIISYSWPVCFLSRFHSTKTYCISTISIVSNLQAPINFALWARSVLLAWIRQINAESPNGDWPEQIIKLRLTNRYVFGSNIQSWNNNPEFWWASIRIIRDDTRIARIRIRSREFVRGNFTSISP